MGNNKNILLTAFCGSSSQLLLKGIEIYETLILPNDKEKDSEKLIDVISKGKFDYIISFGQRPNIKNKVYIETSAHDKDFYISTNFDCDKLERLFNQNQIISKISHNAGTSFCNELYLNGLKYIFQKNLGIKMIFLHIPFSKNIDDFNSFSKRIFDSIACIDKFSP